MRVRSGEGVVMGDRGSGRGSEFEGGCGGADDIDFGDAGERLKRWEGKGKVGRVEGVAGQ